jgi:anti-anti-sigma factor
MNTPTAKMSVLVGEKFACIKISGRANFTSSIDFKTVVNELRQKGYRYFVLDLSDCQLMDSTFLGVLAGLGLKSASGKENEADRAIELLNPNPRITELLETLGVLHLFRVNHGPFTAPAEGEGRDVSPCNPSKEEVTRACLEAHQTLMQVKPENVAKFKDLTLFLAEDLKKLKQS